jgi:hypothetical protein
VHHSKLKLPRILISTCGEKTSVSALQRRVLFLPLIWGAYGLGEVYGLSWIFGPILNSLPFASNDKPISGSYLPALAFNTAMLLAVISLSLYALGIWNIDLSNPKTKRDLGALIIAIACLGLVFYFPILLAGAAVALIYLMAVNIE